MTEAGKRGRYHHGDLRAALVDAAIELIGERGVRNFSLAETARRLDVAVSAPYAHFADRDELLAAVAVRAYEQFRSELESRLRGVENPPERLAEIARAYVLFAAAHRPAFEVLFEAGLDKARHAELEAAEQPIDDMFLGAVASLGAPDLDAKELASAIEAIAHGHAMLLLDRDQHPSADAAERAAARAGRATLAVIDGFSRGVDAGRPVVGGRYELPPMTRGA